MARLGHSSTRAAMIYQHATRDGDQLIAKALGGIGTAGPYLRPGPGRQWLTCGPCVARPVAPGPGPARGTGSHSPG